MKRPARPMRMPPHERDIRAAAVDPAASVFLKANAGSGKTTILTRRVIRLLLSGAEPARILCLTYTKAAAAEMQDRIFRTLAGWVGLDDAALSAEVQDLTGAAPDAAGLARARALFARAVETPGGLKIQTIHAFAERLLHLFPFEANVPVRFAVMDDAAASDLFDDVRRATLRAGLAAPQAPLGRAVGHLVERLGESDLDALLRATLPLLREGAPEADPARLDARLRAALGLRPGDSPERTAAALLSAGFRQSQWRAAIEAVSAGGASPNDRKAIAALEAVIAMPDAVARARAFLALFLTGKGTLIDGRLFTRKHLDAAPWLAAAIDETKDLVPGFIETFNACAAAESSAALTTMAGAALARFRAAKQARALVDFNDMIDLTLALVADPGASWVLRKLDGGIDHLLIDEAQDTTPQMWAIARALTGEFFAGEGARPGRRTVFAVGDDKQSIYSFQGARPEAFAEAREHYRQKVGEAGCRFVPAELKLSFRTVDDILKAVDRVFSLPERFRGLSAEHLPTVHESARAGDPGHVEIWSLEPVVRAEAREAWEEVDALGRNSPQVRLAARIARHIAGQIGGGRLDHDGSAIRPGDIMILIQRRDAFFDAVIRALKREGVPVAGADRLTLKDNIGVLDLIAAARAALLPEDDLTLATALTSPLIGLGDDDLIALAPERAGSLAAALAASPEPRHVAAAQTLAAWRGLAGRETPYGFFATLLGPLGGRRRLLGRLGPDAADGIDIFLEGVLERESRGPSTLVAEVEAFAAHDIDVKRDQEQAGNAVRVLTVHGAKGLEAPLVYLPDAMRLPNLTHDARLFRLEPGPGESGPLLLWAQRKGEAPRRIEALRAVAEASKMDEYRRLFYVAMTRARDRLVLAGWGDADKLNPASWYAMARAALAPEEGAAADETLVWRTTATPPAAPLAEGPAAAPPRPRLPEWACRPAPRDPVVAPPLRPSRLIDAADRPLSPERALARQRGDLVHALLERLPDLAPGERAAAALRYLQTRAPRLSAADHARLCADVLALLERPDLAALFGPDSRAEVAVAGEIAGADGQPRAVLGRIDRLAVTEERVIVADFKTGRRPAAGPEAAHLAQLALYAALVGAIYPGRRIDAVLVWTRSLAAETVAPEALAGALAAL